MNNVRPCTAVLLCLLWLPPSFGQTACPEYIFTNIVDTNTVVPGGNGATFDAASLSNPATSFASVAFRGEGGGAEGVFAGGGNNLSSLASVGDPVAGGGTVSQLFADFSYGDGVADAILTPSGGGRGIYSTVGGGLLTKVVQFGESTPSGGSFSTIFFVSRDGQNLAFQANISFAPANSGVYTRIGGVNEVVADTTFPIPGLPTVDFAGGSFSDPDISGENVTFRAGRGAHIGVYAHVDGSLLKVVDVNDTQPGSTDQFRTFSIPVISGRQVAFRAVGGSSAIYVWNNGTLASIAQAGDPAPGGSTFAGFGQFVATADGDVAFSASGSGFNGLFVSGQFGLCRIIDTDDTLDGKDITQLFMGRDSYAVGKLGFRAVFSDGSRGIYLAEAPRQTSGTSFLQGLLFLLRSDSD